MTRYALLTAAILSTSVNDLSGGNLPETPQRALGELGGTEIQLSRHPLCEYPDIAADPGGDLWVAYTEILHSRERITLLRISEGVIRDSLQVSSREGFEYRPRLLCTREGTLWIVWAARRDGNWDIYARFLLNGKLSPERRITHNPAADLHPVIAGTGDGRVMVVWESLRNGNFDIYQAWLSTREVSYAEPVSYSPDMELRPAVTALGEKGLAVAWDRQSGEGYQVILRLHTGQEWQPEILISPAVGFNLTPALSSNHPKRVTVAWKSNLQPDGNAGLTPWIYMREVRKRRPGPLITLAQPGDWIKSGEDQGFEFPTIRHDQSGACWVFGRPSQGFAVQVVKKDRASSLYRFELPGWGGRGQYVRTALDAHNTLHTVRRDLRYIYLHSLPLSSLTVPLEIKLPVLDARNFAAPRPKPAVKKSASGSPATETSIYFGDIHQHSSLSDGMGTADECYARSRYLTGLDFAALTDHEWFVGNLIIPSEWEWIKIAGQQFLEPGKFITLPGYEWTTPRLPKGFGHKNVFFPTWEHPIFSYSGNAASTLELHPLLSAAGALAIPHHTGWTGTDWFPHDPELQPLVEIVSIHGAFEYMGNEPITHRGGLPGYFVQDGLAQGLKFGFSGSSDGHGLRFHHGIGRRENPWEGGLTGIQTPALAGKEIFSALKERRCYATSGVRIALDFRINGQSMGSSLEIGAPPEIEFSVTGTGPLHYVQLWRDNQVILTKGKDLQAGWGVAGLYQDAALEPGEHWYYLRVIQEDGEMAWSSPIWVSFQEPPPAAE